jgi:hypothetical protein
LEIQGAIRDVTPNLLSTFRRHPLSPPEVPGIMMMISRDGSESYEDYIKILLRNEPNEETLTSYWGD